MLGRDNMRRYSIANLCSDSSPDSESGYASYGSAYRNTVTGYNSDTNVRACSNRYPYGCSDSNSDGNTNGCSDIDPDRCPNSSSYIDPDRSSNNSSDIDTDRCSDIDTDRCPNNSSHSSSVRLISYGAGGARACKQ